MPSLIVDRLFVGCDFAGMTLMTTNPTVTHASHIGFRQLREFVKANNKPLFLQILLLSKKEIGHWISNDHRAEQEHYLLEIPGNEDQEETINTYIYATTIDFTLGMGLLKHNI